MLAHCLQAVGAAVEGVVDEDLVLPDVVENPVGDGALRCTRATGDDAVVAHARKLVVDCSEHGDAIGGTDLAEPEGRDGGVERGVAEEADDEVEDFCVARQEARRCLSDAEQRGADEGVRRAGGVERRGRWIDDELSEDALRQSCRDGDHRLVHVVRKQKVRALQPGTDAERDESDGVGCVFEECGDLLVACYEGDVGVAENGGGKHGAVAPAGNAAVFHRLENDARDGRRRNEEDLHVGAGDRLCRFEGRGDGLVEDGAGEPVGELLEGKVDVDEAPRCVDGEAERRCKNRKRDVGIGVWQFCVQMHVEGRGEDSEGVVVVRTNIREISKDVESWGIRSG